MKYQFLFLVSCLPLFLPAQEKLPDIDPEIVRQQAIEAYHAGLTEQALDLLDHIDENDSIYFDALTEKMSIMLAIDQYDEVIDICDHYLAMGVTNAYAFYINKGVAQMRKEDFQAGLETFNRALEQYPMSYLIHYNKAVALENLEKYDEAIKTYQQTILLNPYYGSPHLRLAWLSYQENLITQAVLCWDMYLMLEPMQDNSLSILVTLNDAVSERNEQEPNHIKISQDDEAFEEMDLIVSNYAALNKGYKVDNKIDVALVKQNHAIFEKLGDFEGRGGFWSEKYVPFFQALFNKGYFNEFVYRIMLSTESAKYQKVIKKNAKKSDEFLGWAGDAWTDICGRGNGKYWGEETKDFQYKSNGVLSSMGEADENNIYNGPFRFFNADGSVLSDGYFTDDVREKDWVWYFEDGSIDTKASYIDGKYNGYLKEYYETGGIKKEVNFKEDYYDGPLKLYTLYEGQTEQSTYVEGTLNGPTVVYFELGEGYKKYDLYYTDDNYDSIATGYFASGEPMIIVNFDNGKRIGEEKHFFRTGELSYLYHYTDGKLNGDYLSLFREGTTHQVGQYTDDNKSGLWKTYFPDGTLSEEENYDEKGRLDGIYKSYTHEGRLHFEYEYSRGNLIAYKYYDKEGKILVNERKQNREFNFKGYHPNGLLSAEGVYEIEGDKQGLWTYYNLYEGLMSTEEYAEGQLNGHDDLFFLDGTLSERTPYKDGEMDGYYESYFINGALERQGYFKAGQKQRIWEYYYVDGTLKDKKFFKDDQLQGYGYSYGIEGYLVEKYFYKDNSNLITLYYDSLGNIRDTLNYLTAEEETFYYDNGKVKSVQHYLHGYAHGDFNWYYPNGKIETEGATFFGDRHGTWKWYNDEGVLTSEVKYTYGDRNGKSLSYHANGQLASLRTYEDDEIHGLDIDFSESGDTTYKATHIYGKRHGPVYNYSEDGQLQLVRYYEWDVLTGYSYPDRNGDLVEMIPVEKGTGTIISYYANGNRACEIGMLQGDFHGSYKKYYPNGNLAIQLNYVAGHRQGDYTEYFPDKQVRERSAFLNDAPHGDYERYHKNGQLAEKATFLNGGKTGKDVFYNKEGKWLKTLVYYNDDVQEAIYNE